MLEGGEIDAMISAHMPSPFVRRHPKVQRLIPNFREVEQDYFKRTRIFPIMHTMVIREEVYDTHPWIAQSLYKAFEESKTKCLEALEDTAASKVTLPFVEEQLRAARALMGNDFLSYGLAANRKVLETFLRHHHAQGLSSRPVKPEELFPPQVQKSFRV